LINRLRPKVLAPSGSGATTQLKIFANDIRAGVDFKKKERGKKCERKGRKRKDKDKMEFKE
jgi:hypothetical protein